VGDFSVRKDDSQEISEYIYPHNTKRSYSGQFMLVLPMDTRARSGRRTYIELLRHRALVPFSLVQLNQLQLITWAALTNFIH
jgi:hypothetical protein